MKKDSGRGDNFVGEGMTSTPALIDLCRELHDMKLQAVALGIFAEDRELLTCPECGLQEDVQADGRLMTFDKGTQDFKDSGLRFADMGGGRFACPRCQTLIDAVYL